MMMNGDTGELFSSPNLAAELDRMGIKYSFDRESGPDDEVLVVSNRDFGFVVDRLGLKRKPKSVDLDDVISKVNAWADDARAQFESGNYGVGGDLSGYAYDMADSIRWELTGAEWDEYVDFIGDEEDAIWSVAEKISW